MAAGRPNKYTPGLNRAERQRIYRVRVKDRHRAISAAKRVFDANYFKGGLLSCLKRISDWLVGESSVTPIREPKCAPLSYTEQICKCGMIFYTDSEIPNHICKPS